MNKTLEEAKYLTKDLIQGDESIVQNEIYQTLSYDDIQKALSVIVNNPNLTNTKKMNMLNNLWRINYEVKPPTMEEFLSPKYIGEMGDKVYPHVRETLLNFMNPYGDKRVLALSTAIGYGKALTLDTKVYTPKGKKTIKDIQIGDKVSIPSGKYATVIKTSFFEDTDIFKIIFSDGSTINSSKEHLWKVGRKQSIVSWDKELKKSCYSGYGIIWETKELQDIVKDYKKRRYFVPQTTAIEFEKKQDLFIHPYIMGAILGDGQISDHGLNITSMDSDIVNKINSLLIQNKCELNELSNGKIKSKAKRYSIRMQLNRFQKTNPYIDEFKRLNLFNKNQYNKFIPDIYKYSSIEDRKELIRGLLDTDGTIDSKDYSVSISLCNKRLINDLREVIESLGGFCSYCLKSDGMHKLQIRLNDLFNPFYLKRKAKIFEDRKNKVNRSYERKRYINSIEYIGKHSSKCITLDNEEGLFLVDNFIVTHNSSLSAILILYIILNLIYMRDAKKFFNLGPMGSLVAALISFTQKKASQLLLKPFINLINVSPIFHKVRQEDRLLIKQKELPKGEIAWTSAGRLGNVQFIKDIHIAIVSDRADLLGLNIFAGVASEISFWINRGIAPDDIMGTFNDLRGRIKSRFGSAYLTATILDSSPIDVDASPIDAWLYKGEAEKDPEVMLVNAKHWEVYKDLKPAMYKNWIKTGETFPVFRGSSSKTAKIVSGKEINQFSKDEIIDVPIDLYDLAQADIKKFVADYAAYPAGGLSKLFENFEDIHNIFVPFLKNQYSPVNIPEQKDPKKLIWNQIKNRFFIHIDNHYEFYRNPLAHRTVHIDLSITGDISGITMSHVELNKQGEKVYIHDFNIPLHKGDTRMNIDAVCEFVFDLKKVGNIKLFKVTADGYESETILQRMRRADIKAEKLSLDKTTGPYMLYIAEVKGGRVKAGKSIHLKNNLKSLMEVHREESKVKKLQTKKIDHIQGTPIYEDSGTWETSQVGYRAKDISDTAAGSVYILITEYLDIPRYVYDEEYEQQKTDSKKVIKDIEKEFLLKSSLEYVLIKKR